MAATQALIAELEGLLNQSSKDLPKTTSKKMFGCHALWADGAVYALVWKHGRIGVKLPDEAQYEKLLGLDGSEPWKAGKMTMSHWVLVPPAFHAKAASLKPWLKKAHQLAIGSKTS